MAERLAGLQALVTGASGGVGGGIALALARAGASVWATGRREDELMAVAAAGRPAILPVTADLRSPPDLDRLIQAVRQAGRLDILVHAAGVFDRTPVSQLESPGLDDVMSTNLSVPHLLTRAFLPLLTERGGQIVFINSSISRGSGVTGAPAYSASKLALRGYADALRAEVNPDGVKVCTIYLGRTASGIQARLHAAEGRAYHPERLIQPSDVGELVVAVVSLPRSVEATDLSLRPMLPPSDTPARG